MNPADPLAQLADIHLPDPVSAWPPAPGWWLLALLIIGLVIGAIVFLVQRYRKRAWRREALAYLRELQTRQDQLPGTDMASALSGLLKQVAITRFGRHQTASLSGDTWLRFLDDKGKTTAFTQGPGRALGDDIYRPDAVIDVEGLFKLSQEWIEKQS